MCGSCSVRCITRVGRRGRVIGLIVQTDGNLRASIAGRYGGHVGWW